MAYEIRDRHNPRLRGMRFVRLERAKKELTLAVPADRWFIFDTTTKQEVRHG